MEVLTKVNPPKRRTSIPSPSQDEVPSLMDISTTSPEDSRSPHMPQESGWETKFEATDVDSLPAQASLSHSYCLEWENLFTKPDMMKKLKEKAIDGNLRSSRFRSVAWRIFLEVLPPDMSEWIERTRKSRKSYEEMKNRLIVNPRKAVDCVDITLNNPLSQDEEICRYVCQPKEQTCSTLLEIMLSLGESPWNKFFQDNELRLTIKQDVIRTYPKIEFFQSNQLRNLMVDILFIFAKENADVSYQQGMHELLAPLIFVLHCDHQAFLHACEIDSVLSSQEAIMKAVLDPVYLEHDAYAMFCQVMETAEPWYLSRDVFNNQSKSGSARSLELINSTPFSKSQDLNPSSAIVKKLTRIQDGILKSVDHDLHQHLEQQEIVPQIYGIRWLRLLFGREFPMQDLLMLWDAIFGDGISFDLVDYIFVAMLLYLREILLTSDYTVCLTILMKFPPVPDVHYFVAKGLWIREPDLYLPLHNYTHQGSIRVSSSMGSSIENISSDGGIRDVGTTLHRHHSHKQQNSMFGGFSSFSRKFSRPRTLSVPKSSSEPMNLQTDVSPNHATDPKGSTVSLSHVDESMFRHTTLASSLAQLEGTNLRSAQSSPGVHHSAMFPLTPDDISITSSPPKYNNLPSKSGHHQRMSKMERELQEKIAVLQRELNDKKSMCRYCSSKLDVHIGRLQQDIPRQNSQIDDDIMMSLAGLKLVRDILNGTVSFSQEITAEDDDIPANYDYDGSQDGGGGNFCTGITSPDSDILLNTASSDDVILKISGQQRLDWTFKGNEDTSSPDSIPHETIAKSFDSKFLGSKVIELADFQNLDRSVKAGSSMENISVEGRKLSAEKDIGFESYRKNMPSSSDSKSIHISSVNKNMPSSSDSKSIHISSVNKNMPSSSDSKSIHISSVNKNIPSSTCSKNTPSFDDIKKIPSFADNKNKASSSESKILPSSIESKSLPISIGGKNAPSSSSSKNVSSSGNFTSKFLRMFKIDSSSDTHSSAVVKSLPSQQNVPSGNSDWSLIPRIFNND